ncbi:ABC transporter ATP-binding protein [Geodermatophilus nigrescens]|uniref:Amino acid/amide ABC transporter ATP-binding protein 2, HAAT family n=1 Tax=Geodermatophilus nigrescens TaxID=1070870 RepID=A0A1M5IR43_9ACTN|nr:ABC transporter ATP-binding protein [Geodermatophilus nigrescens]SHG30787.1 amino acid/amide ABC transporter ATP-binding protein 2, HAAT family [Geodermatophilus nigrescens]
MSAPLLEVDDVEVAYGDAVALPGLSVAVAEGETLALVGANGAGKSTLLRTVCGLLRPRRGAVRLDGDDVTALPAHARVARGIAMSPEGRRLFPSLSVEENLLVGGYARRRGPWDLAAVYELFPLVAERRSRPAANLSGGEQQAVAIGRALMANPRLLLLDEVSLGLAPVVVAQLYAALPRITGQGTTVLVVEQDVHQAMAVADRVQCLLEGRTVLEGPAERIDRTALAAAYFGVAR